MKPDCEHATLDGRSRAGIVARGKRLLEKRFQQLTEDRAALPGYANPNQRRYHALRLEREQSALAESAAALERLQADGLDVDGSEIETR